MKTSRAYLPGLLTFVALSVLGVGLLLSSSHTRAGNSPLGGTMTPTASPTACSGGTGCFDEATASTFETGTTLVPNSQCDDCYRPINFPFPVHIDSHTFMTGFVVSNGILTFDEPEFPKSDNTCLPDPVVNSAVYAFWDDLIMSSDPQECGPNCGIFTATYGASPNRRFVIEWRASIYTATIEPVNFAITLYESQSRFDINYGVITGGGYSATVGVQFGSSICEHLCNDPEGVSQGLKLSYPRTPCGSVTPTPQVTATATPCPMNFTDVSPTDFFYEPVRYLYCRGIISGYQDNTFRPFNSTTRSQMTKIVVLGFEIPLSTHTTPTFNDVPTSNPFFQFIETAVENNIVAGYACGGEGEPCPGAYFRPFNLVTRGQLSKIVVNAAGWQIINPGTPTFNDVPSTSAFYAFVETAYCHQIISGYTCGAPGEPCPGLYFRSGSTATRGQISKIVYLAILDEAPCSP